MCQKHQVERDYMQGALELDFITATFHLSLIVSTLESTDMSGMQITTKCSLARPVSQCDDCLL